MTSMVRKQVYIEPRQEALLKRLAQAHKVSEAELIRQAIDRQLGAGPGPALPSDPDAWEHAYQFMLELLARGPVADKGRAWKREDLYEERLSRYGRDPD
jgi:hypothetical protein